MTISTALRTLRVIVLAVLIVEPPGRAYAQIILTPSIGCAPLAVQFSGPSGASNVYWDLAVGTTTVTNPSNIYQAGNYNITYTAMVGGNPVTYTALLVVTTPPTGNLSYTLPSSHCAPMTVTLSGSGGSAGSGLNWSFGDLTPLASGSLVTHTYVSKGSFNPALTIVDAITGCTAVASNSSGPINVSNPPVLIITANPGFFSCTYTHAAVFSGSTSLSGSPLPGQLTAWSWTFGGGTPSSATGSNSPLVFFGAGQHTVMLSATDNNQCSSTAKANVSVQGASLALPAHSVMCFGDDTAFTVSSTEPVMWWTEPGGTPTMVTSSPELTFSIPGLNIYTVTINPPFPCAALTKTFSMFVEVITPILVSTTPTASCNGSLVVTYTGTAISNTNASISYTWELDGGSGYNSATPNYTVGNPMTFTFYQSKSTNQYTIYKPWEPRIRVTMESNSQGKCINKANYDKTAVVQRPTAWFYTNVSEGCSPLAVKFRDSSQTWLPDFPLVGYTMNIGVGSLSMTGTGTMSPFTYTYSTGVYHPWMIVRTSTLTNCIDTSYLHEIRVGQPPSPSIALPTNSVCAGTAVQLTLSTSPTSTAPPHWHVNADLGFYSHCITDSIPSWPFTHTGTHGLTVSAYDRGCEGTQASTASITVKGPYAGMRVQGSCLPGQRNTVVISSRLEEVSTATLYFGDNSSLSIVGNDAGVVSHSVSHTYSASGNYAAVLVTENSISGCSARTFSVPVIIRDAQAKITFNNATLPSLPVSIGCAEKTYSFSGINSTDVMTSCERGYTWQLFHPKRTYQPRDRESPAYTDTVLMHPGVYTLTLRVKDQNGCEDTNTVRFRLSGGSADFSITANPLCFSTGTVLFLNTSLDSLHPFDNIDTSKWDFGDGSIYIPTNPLENPVHQYQYAANPFIVFSVSLITVNNLGCSDTIGTTIQVNNPFPDLQPSSTHPCIPKGSVRTITLNAAAGYPTYSVNTGMPGAGWNVYSQNTMAVTYYTPGVFETTLVVVDAGNCRAEQVVTVTAIGQPTASIIMGDNASKFCLPGTPTLISVSNFYDSPITNTLWTIANVTTPAPGTGTFHNHIFTNTGVFTVSLTVNSDGYCPSTTFTNIVVADPHAKLKINKTKFCLGDTIKVSLTDSSEVEGWRWFYGDFNPQPVIYANSLFAKMYPVLSYPYNIFPSDSAGNTQLTLQYFGTQGSCQRTQSVNLTVIELHTSFAETQNIYRHCLRRSDQFTVSTVDHWNLGLQYFWNFGDGIQGVGQPVSHTYKDPGVFNIVMTVRDSAFACKDTAVRTMTVLPLPSASLSVSPGLICPGDTVTLTGRGTPGVGGLVTGTVDPAGIAPFNAQNEFTMRVAAYQNTSYVLQVEDENDCLSDLVNAPTQIVPPHPQKFWDTTIVIGQTVMLNAYAGSGYSYTWAPIVTDLSCVNCFSPVSTSTNDIIYTVQITDHPLQCYTLPSTFSIHIQPLVTLDVPTAFTPNGDGLNDFIYPDGWGLKRLVYFRIFNRWGQLIFEGRDLKPGWDGTYAGVPQNSETYVYQVAAETLLGTTLSKSGTFKLLR